LEAYYGIIDDCKDYPLWQRKIQEDLGGVVSFLAIQIGEAVRDQVVERSPMFERYDMEKQIYFK